MAKNIYFYSKYSNNCHCNAFASFKQSKKPLRNRRTAYGMHLSRGGLAGHCKRSLNQAWRFAYYSHKNNNQLGGAETTIKRAGLEHMRVRMEAQKGMQQAGARGKAEATAEAYATTATNEGAAIGGGSARADSAGRRGGRHNNKPKWLRMAMQRHNNRQRVHRRHNNQLWVQRGLRLWL